MFFSILSPLFSINHISPPAIFRIQRPLHICVEWVGVCVYTTRYNMGTYIRAAAQPADARKGCKSCLLHCVVQLITVLICTSSHLFPLQRIMYLRSRVPSNPLLKSHSYMPCFPVLQIPGTRGLTTHRNTKYQY